MSFYAKYKLLEPEDCEQVVKEVLSFKQIFYNDENLKSHIAYLADQKPGRYSHAYAFNGPDALPDLPGLPIDEIFKFPELCHLMAQVSELMDYSTHARFLFNVQEYYSDNAMVPKHFDGELLDFDVNPDDTLNIKRAIRPMLVGVLTLINDIGEVGTRVHSPDNLDAVIPCQPGELLIFDNKNCFHSVDAFHAKAKRKDGIARMTIGWRGLNENCFLYNKGNSKIITRDEADKLTLQWYNKVWPEKWAAIEKNLGKAPF
jgi:hypothetical protein